MGTPSRTRCSRAGVLRSFHVHHSQHHQLTNDHTQKKTFTPRTHHTRFILMLTTCDAYRAHRHGSESPYPGSTPGLNPCNHLARQACGPWRTHRHKTYMQTHRLHKRQGELMIHQNRRAARPHQRGHHQAGGAETVAAEAEAEAARAGGAEQLSKMGAPGVAGRRRGSVATSGRPQQRVLVERRSQGPSGSSGRAWVQPTKLGREEPEEWNCRYWRGAR